MCAYKNNKIILKGYRNHKDGLWDIPIKKTSITSKCCFAPITHPGLYGTKSNITNSHNMPKTNHDNIKCIKPVKHKKVADIINWDDELRHQQDWNKNYINNQKANVIIRKKQTRVELVQYLHAACYSPVASTFVQVIKKGFFKTWPGLTPELVEKHLPPSIASAKGHIVQEKQHLQSTKTKKSMYSIDVLCDKTKDLSINAMVQKPITQKTTDISYEQDHFPPSPTPNVKSNSVAYLILNTDEVSTGYIDLTGRFPRRSSRGNEYILVGYHDDGNAILAAPIKDRTANTITKAWHTMHNKFKLSGTAPTVYVLDNEKSLELVNLFDKENIKYQLSPPNNHRTNKAERAIQTFKHHLKAGLASTDPNFPLSEWDRLIEQAVITLNLLRSSRIKSQTLRVLISLRRI